VQIFSCAVALLPYLEALLPLAERVQSIQRQPAELVEMERLAELERGVLGEMVVQVQALMAMRRIQVQV
jgi:predicted amidohydrolase